MFGLPFLVAKRFVDGLEEHGGVEPQRQNVLGLELRQLPGTSAEIISSEEKKRHRSFFALLGPECLTSKTNTI